MCIRDRFEGKTTGTPIALEVRNKDQRSKDYSAIMDLYRPGHADYTFDQKYGFRDYRGGGRSSGRETVGRVAAGAVAAKILKELGVEVRAFTRSIGPVEISPENFSWDEIANNKLYMPDARAAKEAQAYLEKLMGECDSAGGVVECRIEGLPAGVGEPVFDKLDANLAKAILSIGAVKGFEIGEGFEAARLTGSEDNDEFASGTDESGGRRIYKKTNHAGGVLGGISDGSPVVFRAAFKPTASIARQQHTVCLLYTSCAGTALRRRFFSSVPHNIFLLLLKEWGCGSGQRASPPILFPDGSDRGSERAGR